MERHLRNLSSFIQREWEGVVLTLITILGLIVLVLWFLMIRGWGAPVPSATPGRGADDSVFATSAFSFLDGGEAPRVPPNNCVYTTYFRPIPKPLPPPALEADPIPIEIVDAEPIEIIIEDAPPIIIADDPPDVIASPPEPDPEPDPELPPPPRHFVQYNGVMTSPSGEQLAIITYDVDDQGQNERKAYYLKEGRSVLGFRVRQYSRGMVLLEDPANEIDPFVIRLGQRLELVP
ncbi:MAG: hypothetical protein ACI8W8_001796 [Rhodothermales bacterium]|jgi:hypothetical protein